MAAIPAVRAAKVAADLIATTAATAAAASAAASAAAIAATAAVDLGVHLKTRLDRVEQTLDKVSDSLVMLVRLEERMSASTADEQDVKTGALDRERRLQIVERSMGPLLEARKWVIAGGLGVISLVGVSVFNAFTAYQSKVEAALQARTTLRVLATPQAERSALVPADKP